MPSAPREPESAREELQRAAPAIVITLAMHGLLAWWLLRPPAPWSRPPVGVSKAAIEIEFFSRPRTMAPAPPPAMPEEPADSVPFPSTQPSVTEAPLRSREPEPSPLPSQPIAPAVSAAALFGDIAGVAEDMAGTVKADGRRGKVQLPGREDAFIDAGVSFKPPPPTPEQIAQAVTRKLLSTRGANNITDFMGLTEGRDPGREIQRGHHAELYLPRGCDDPDDPNLSDECMGIPKR